MSDPVRVTPVRRLILWNRNDDAGSAVGCAFHLLPPRALPPVADLHRNLRCLNAGLVKRLQTTGSGHDKNRIKSDEWHRLPLIRRLFRRSRQRQSRKFIEQTECDVPRQPRKAGRAGRKSGADKCHILQAEVDKLRNNRFVVELPISDELSKNLQARLPARNDREGRGAGRADPAQFDVTGFPSSQNAPASGRWCSRHRCCRRRRHRRLPVHRGTCSPR
jgi:hypothetical protein